jgi:hypothetical protein
MRSNNIDVTIDENQLIWPHFILADSAYERLHQPFKLFSGKTKVVVVNQVQPTNHRLSQAKFHF